jgi:hypothetical protein
MEHQVQQKNTEIIPILQDDEEVLFEGELHCRSFYCGVFLMILVSMMSIFAIPIGLWVACAFVGCSNWRLHLTHSAIYHNGLCHVFVIPLSYIKNISADGDGKCIHVVMERERGYKLIPWYERPCLWHCLPPENIDIMLKYVANSDSFVQAVEREIATSATS